MDVFDDNKPSPAVREPEEIKILMKNVLTEYASCGVIGIACDRCGVRRKDHTKWMAMYPKYKELFEEIKDRFVDGLESVAIERAKEKSDSLLILMLKSHRPETYGDKSEINMNHHNAPITLVFADGMLNEDEKKLLGGDRGGESDTTSNQDGPTDAE